MRSALPELQPEGRILRGIPIPDADFLYNFHGCRLCIMAIYIADPGSLFGAIRNKYMRRLWE